MSKEFDNAMQTKILELRSVILNNSDLEVKDMTTNRNSSTYNLNDYVVNALFEYEIASNNADVKVLNFCETYLHYKINEILDISFLGNTSEDNKKEMNMRKKFSELRILYQKGALQLSSLTNDEILQLLRYEAVYQKYSSKTDIRFIVDLLTERIFNEDFQIP